MKTADNPATGATSLSIFPLVSFRETPTAPAATATAPIEVGTSKNPSGMCIFTPYSYCETFAIRIPPFSYLRTLRFSWPKNLNSL